MQSLPSKPWKKVTLDEQGLGEIRLTFVSELDDEANNLFRQAGIRPQCLRLTKQGQPGHPLRLRRDLTLFPMM